MRVDSVATRQFQPKPALTPPSGRRGPLGWAAQSLFRTPLDACLTVVSVASIAFFSVVIFEWAVTEAVWDADSRRECLDRSPAGACWAGVRAWWSAFMYGRYTEVERWRVDAGLVLAVMVFIPMWWSRLRARLVYLSTVALALPPVLGYLFLGGERVWWFHGLFTLSVVALLDCGWRASRVVLSVHHPVREPTPRARALVVLFLAVLVSVGTADWSLEKVGTNLWGGMFLTLLIALVGVAASVPVGIALALGRRSSMSLLRAIIIAYIELLRSVPFITVLFMVVTMPPLFLPVALNPDKLALALLGIALFSSAYMAEIVRGGLQAVPAGQFEAACSVGLRYWPMMRWVVLPQALRHMIPNIASSFIGLLKDTTVVALIGLYDFSRMLNAPGSHPTWIGLHIETFVLGGVVYFLMCYSMSKYSRHLERQLDPQSR